MTQRFIAQKNLALAEPVILRRASLPPAGE
jgi:hypothetical protein